MTVIHNLIVNYDKNVKKDEWNYKAYRTSLAYTYLNEYGMDILIQ